MQLSLLIAGAAVIGFGMIHLRYSLPQEGTSWKGRGLFVIHQLQKSSSPFQHYWRYDGEFKWFLSEAPFRNIPCSLSLPHTSAPPTPHHAYILEGTLHRDHNSHFSFKQEKGVPWEIAPWRIQWAGLRFHAKEAIRSHLKRHLKEASCAQFLAALATGETEERAVSHNFGALGLQHLLAISGFHFGLIAMTLSWTLSLFLSPRQNALCLLPLITLYFFFIGPTPSCFRAWMTISLFLLASIFSWRASGLNLLGTSLIASLLINPLSLTTLGFQLSYLITLAILLFYPLLETLLSSLLPPRTLRSLLTMPRLDQHGYIFSALIRSALAINGAVHLFALPVLLFYFGKFPLLSLLYNLFLPFLVGLSLFMLLTAFILSPLPSVSPLIHLINTCFTSWILKLTAHPPTFFQYFLRAPPLPPWVILLYLTLSFWVGIELKDRFAAEKLTESPF